ncbi:MAG: metalloprotease [Hyphomicrobiales bacterium]|nr:metalloprotease [Hyphomicrobiales bacterium]
MLEQDEAEPILAVSTQQQAFLTGNETMIARSGNRDFDYALAQTLSRLTDTFGVLPGFAYFDDVSGENAYATNARRLAQSDGAVLVGKRLFMRLMGLNEHPDVALTAICAHEFAHILQFKTGISRRLRAGQPTVKRLELHADYLAGYYAGIRKLQRPQYPAAVFAATQHAFGDNRSDNPDHHGTHDERAAAVVRGFEVAYRERRRFSEAVQIGISYVSAL